jgi:nitronate monooxygenase
MVFDDVRVPIVLAPLAGGPSTPALVAAVCEAGAFGFLASGYLTGEQLADQLGALRSSTGRPFGVNVFTPAAHASDPAGYGPYAEKLKRWAGSRGLPLGEPRFDDDAFDEKVALLVRDPAAVVSFTFGMPGAETIARLHRAGSEVWVTVTTPAEAAIALEGGADALVLQGSEAGGHRGSFDDGEGGGYSTLSLLQLLDGAARPLVAAGGVMTGSGVAAVLAAGARAAQLGTAFLLCPEAGTSPPHREAIRRADAPTKLTRAFTGRAARGIVNEFMTEHDPAAVSAYPEIHHVTQPLRRDARARGDGSMINLWAGEAYALARELPAGELVGVLAAEAGAQLSAER